MATRTAWISAIGVLRRTYAKLIDQNYEISLHDRLDDLDDEALVEAINRHVNDATEANGQIVGNWPPKPAQIRAHAHAIAAEVEAERLAEIKQRAAELDTAARSDAPTQTVDVDGDLAGMVGDRLTLSASDCARCADSGLRIYYADPLEPSRLPIWRDQYNDLDSETRTPYRQYSAVCNCDRGRLKRDQLAGAISGFPDSGGKMRRGYLRAEEIETLIIRGGRNGKG